MCSIVIIIMQQQQTISCSRLDIGLHVLAWHTVHGNIVTLFVEPSSVRYIDKHVHVCWDVSHRIQRSDDYDKLLLHGMKYCSRHIRRLSPQPGREFSQFRIHINVVFKNVVCKFYSNVRRGCTWHDVNSEHIIEGIMRFPAVMPCVSVFFFLRFRKVYFCVIMTFLNSPSAHRE